MTQVQEAALLFFRSALTLTGQSLPDLELAYLTFLGYTVGTNGYSSFTIRDMVVSGAITIGP